MEFITETATIHAFFALILTMTFIVVNFIIFYMIFYVMFWGIAKVLAPIFKILNHG